MAESETEITAEAAVRVGEMFQADDMISKRVRTEVPVDGQTVSKYSFVSRTVDSDVARKPLFYH